VQVNVKYTYSDLLTVPDDGNRYELFEGELIMTPSPILLHQIASDNLVYKLKQYNEVYDIGVIVSAPFDVYFDDENVVQPDIIFVSNERRSIVEEKRIKGTPDLIVEILSPRTKDRDYGFKFRKYAEVGVKEYWIADPEGKTIEVYQLSEKGFELYKSFSGNDIFESGMFSGLSFLLSDIWKH
jgi:Uma2 family endonuclease